MSEEKRKKSDRRKQSDRRSALTPNTWFGPDRRKIQRRVTKRRGADREAGWREHIRIESQRDRFQKALRRREMNIFANKRRVRHNYIFNLEQQGIKQVQNRVRRKLFASFLARQAGLRESLPVEELISNAEKRSLSSTIKNEKSTKLKVDKTKYTRPDLAANVLNGKGRVKFYPYKKDFDKTKIASEKVKLQENKVKKNELNNKKLTLKPEQR